ncbi:hypothetical protein ES707_06719 [subsurface metagenome]
METNLDTLEARTIGNLRNVIEDLEISPHIVEAFTGINYRRIYRWLGQETAFFKLDMKEIKVVLSFCENVEHIRSDWSDIVLCWDGRYHKATRLALYRRPYLRVLRSKADYESKIKTLTKMTVLEWAKKARK